MCASFRLFFFLFFGHHKTLNSSANPFLLYFQHIDVIGSITERERERIFLILHRNAWVILLFRCHCMQCLHHLPLLKVNVVESVAFARGGDSAIIWFTNSDNDSRGKISKYILYIQWNKVEKNTAFLMGIMRTDFRLNRVVVNAIQIEISELL